MRLSSCIGPTVTNQTCYLWLIHTYERLSMIYNPVIIRLYCQIWVRYWCISLNKSVFQVVGYEKSQGTERTDVILSSYIMLHHILCFMYEECSLSHRNCMFWINFPCLHFMPYSWSGESSEYKESYIMGKPMPWCRSCRNFKCQFATGESEPWDLWQHVSAYPSICLNGIPRH